MTTLVPLWRRARCVLCTAPLLVRDDNEQVVCSACGARLEALPAVGETRVRHVGEDLDSVRDTLEREAVRRALERLRERQAAQTVALGGELTSANVRRVLSMLGALLAAIGTLMAIAGLGSVGVITFFLGLGLMLATFGGRSGVMDSQQRQRERAATRARQALAREIARRERFLTEVSRASPSEARS